MKQEYRDWFIENRKSDQEVYNWPDRSYSYTNFHISVIPFHKELKDYIYELNGTVENTAFDCYHVHTWKEGDFFDEHLDNNFKRKWTYVCELKASECNTSLLVENQPIKEGIFDCNVLHRVPKIERGTRISLTVFGSSPNTLI